ncbi:MAG: GNAT family N-acetyltransferase [Rubripirellula sp.]
MNTEVRLMAVEDIDEVIHLCRGAGWNQTRQDWNRLIRYQPNGCFAAVIDDQIVGTVTTTSYRDDLAWIGMMLVDERYRRRGVATRLMKASLEHLTTQQVRCIKLDATPLGFPVYQRLGFRAEWGFQRWERGSKVNDESNRSVGDELNESHLTLDRQAFGADRSAWLQLLAADSTTVTHPLGFGMIRPGHLADYLGPVVAESVDAGSEIIQQLLAQQTGRPVFWDLPHVRDEWGELPTKLGFQPVRDLTRMWFGTELVGGDVRQQFAIAEPATG